MRHEPALGDCNVGGKIIIIKFLVAVKVNPGDFFFFAFINVVPDGGGAGRLLVNAAVDFGVEITLRLKI